jgi:hypothetical protein
VNPDSQPLVVQHNALVNARFSFSTLETRLFLALLVRINRGDTTFSVHRIPIKEISPDSSSNALYADVDEMTKKLAARVLHIEVLGPNGERIKQPDRMNRPLMYQCDYIKSEGVVEARFNEGVRDYLLNLRHNFTQAQLSQLLLIRSSASHRIYWLVKEYAQQGKIYRDIEVSELRNVLGLTTEYANRFDHLKARVLDRAQAELATTDVPFTMEFFRQGKAVRTIRFHFASTAKVLIPAAPEEGSWQALLIRTGIAGKSLPAIQAKLEAGDYPEGYIRFVVTTMEAQVSAGKVKKLAGAVFKALTDKYLLPAYEKQLQPQLTTMKSKNSVKTKFTKLGTSVVGERKRLLSELEDARGTLKFANSSPVYTDETRPAVLQNIQTRITSLEEQLAGLDS